MPCLPTYVISVHVASYIYAYIYIPIVFYVTPMSPSYVYIVLYPAYLQLAFQRDPDLHSLPRQHLSLIIQSLYISTGCDYILYVFQNIRQGYHYQQFYAICHFYCNSNAVGCLHNINSADEDVGFLSFVRLVGTCYFKKTHT